MAYSNMEETITEFTVHLTLVNVVLKVYLQMEKATELHTSTVQSYSLLLNTSYLAFQVFYNTFFKTQTGGQEILVWLDDGGKSECETCYSHLGELITKLLHFL